MEATRRPCRLLHDKDKDKGTDSEWRINPTFECNANCEYCVVSFRHRPEVQIPAPAGREMLTGKQWVEIIKRLDAIGPRYLVVSGGEPFMHPGMMQIIMGVAPMVVRLNTNFGLVTDDQIREMADRDPPVKLFISYHFNQPGVLDEVEFVRRIQLAKDVGSDFTIHSIGYPFPWSLDHVVARFRRSYDICLGVHKDLRQKHFTGARSHGPGRHVECKTRRLRLIGPDGYRYPCLSSLYRGVNEMRMENLLYDEPTGLEYTTECRDFGFCLACDVQASRRIMLKEKAHDGPKGAEESS